MANVTASSSTNIGAGPLSPTEINFEDLITVNNVLLDQSPGEENSTVDGNISSPNNDIDEMYSVILPKQIPTSSATILPKNPDLSITQQKIVSLTKIVPKQTTTTTTAKMSATVKTSNPGQVVIIQGPSGPVPIRIAGSSTTATKLSAVASHNANNAAANPKTTTLSPKEHATSKNPPLTIQVLKMPDGSLVPLKNNKALNLTNLSNISQLNVGSGTPVIVKTTNGQKVVTGAQTKLSSGAPVLKSLTLAEVQKAGFIKPKPLDGTGVGKLQKILPSPSTSSISSSISSTTVTSSTTLPSKEVTVKSESDGTTKQIVVSQHMLKLQSSAGGNIQAIQIPGKPGLQYVRVLGSSGSTPKLMSTIKKDTSPTKAPVSGAQRVVMTSAAKPGLSLINAPKDTTATAAKNNMRFISTIPTLRKIQDPIVSKPSSSIQIDNESSSSTNTRQLIPIKKVNQTSLINNVKSEPKLLTSQVAISSISRQQPSSSSVPQQSYITKIEPRSISIEEKPRTKQFSTLKSPPLQISLQRTPDFKDDQLSILLIKRSPSPEALRRKHCNCTKSQCLKLYCDCFANGEFCQDCNCKECFNNLEYEDERQKAIKICLERNPNAFKPKITKAKDQNDLRLHNKGCNCKRSGCLKNYCECYEAKIACSSNCKCFGCRNVEDRSDRDLFEDNQPAAPVQPTERARPPKRPHEESSDRYPLSSTSAATRLQDGQPANKQPYNFITQDVVDATIQCMIAQADECKKNGMNHKITERMIIEELGRCLVEIIDFSIRNMDN